MVDGEYNHYESIEEWDCPYCFKAISSFRPPVFNPNNCSCVETGLFVNEDNESSEPSPYQLQGVQYQPAVCHQQPQSYMSSSVSVSCPEGPELEHPNINLGNTYLPLGPDMGLNEAQHRQSASFYSDISYQMHRFLVDEESSPPRYWTETTPSETKFLPQNIHIQSQREKSAKKRSKPSYQSLSSGSGDASFNSWGGDLTAAVGTQFEPSGNGCFEDEYPLAMSGMTDSHSEE
jgi:hypothetical protein